jgi:uncharacterized protein YbjT (DUF2867 family)
VVVVAGATGLVGRALVQLLAADGAWREVRALVRRPLPSDLVAPTVVPVQVDYGNLGASPTWAAGVDHMFCALGTTIRQAGSPAAFRQVDFAYSLAFATAGLAQGAHHFLLVSALGADPDSRIFYNRVKGELERAVTALSFRSLTVARPSLLLGARTERRLGEQIGKIVGVLAPAPWRPIPAAKVASALVAAAKRDAPGTQVLDNRQLRAYCHRV